LPRAVAFRNQWGLDPGVSYTYRTFDEAGQFHVVQAGMADNEGHFLLISVKTGLIFRTFGVPTFSPDKTRFYAAGGNGMGCIESLAVYRYESDKLFREAESSMGCDTSCSHEWVDSKEIKSICKNARDGGNVEYRLLYRDETWRATKSIP
jgi:hypothetical protein